MFALAKAHQENVTKLRDVTFDIIASRRKEYASDQVIRLVLDEFLDTYKLLKQLILAGKISAFESDRAQAAAAFSIVFWGIVGGRDNQIVWNQNVKALEPHLNKVETVLLQFSHSSKLSFHIPDTKFLIENERRHQYQYEKWLHGHSGSLRHYISHVVYFDMQVEMLLKRGLPESAFDPVIEFFATHLSDLEIALLYFLSLTPLGQYFEKTKFFERYQLLNRLDPGMIPLELLPRR